MLTMDDESALAIFTLHVVRKGSPSYANCNAKESRKSLARKRNSRYQGSV